MNDSLDGWRWALTMAREGDPRYLFERLCSCTKEHATGEFDESGRRIWRLEYMPLPDDGELRREIVEALMDKPWAGRGRKAALHPVDAAALRASYALLRVSMGYTDAQARDFLRRAFNLASAGTLDDILRERKTYAPGHKAPKEPVRAARKKAR